MSFFKLNIYCWKIIIQECIDENILKKHDKKTLIPEIVDEKYLPSVHPNERN